ncbi:probable tRNA-specific 2-thiouridylase MnmA at C-terminar half [Coccomyxa sp. Obi]|nr:probable tRNA-specific 2-thiouridylase MnmA at C-terminar half [Coccomyxa sp. Obi]
MVAPTNGNGKHKAIDWSETDVAIIGGGVVGVIAARRMQERGIDYKVLERQHDFGGVWHTHGNNHSTLQAPELSYRTHPNYPLGKHGPLEQITGNAVLTRLREMAVDLGIDKHTDFCGEVETIRQQGDDYLLVIRDVNTKEERHVLAKHIIVCHGILGRQYRPEERKLAVMPSFQKNGGIFTMGGRWEGKDCAVSGSDINGKNVVVIGGGAFACEAMRAAVNNGAASVVMVTREKSKWIIPFSRQFVSSAIALTPLFPWAWKMAVVKWWLTKCYYEPCGLTHLIPSGGPKDMNYTGQSHDGFFEFARDGRVKHVLGTATTVDGCGVTLKDGTQLPAHMVIYCGGCEYQGSPPFLKDLKLGFEDLHSFAFLGKSGRIGTASDGLFSYVPAGPNKQIDMFLHAYDLRKEGRLQELQAALEHTPIPHDDVIAKGHRTVWYTWFETFKPNSNLSCLFELRNKAYKKVMSAGLSDWGKRWLAIKLICGELFLWNMLCILGTMEKFHKCETHGPKLRIALLLSGGVDSSLALRLLQAAGHDVTAFYLQIWFQEDFRNYWDACPWEEDLAICEQVCKQAGVELRTVPLTEQYWQRVVSHCLAEIKAGRTPNPDMLCNSRVKFGAFYEHLEAEHGARFDRIASGHYARVIRDPGNPSAPVKLALTPDPVKDQTYFLAHLTQQQLSRTIFPLGTLTKEEVRRWAAELQLPNQARRDSQGICFLGKVRFSEFVREHLGTWPGPIVEEETGDVVGHHDGFWFYTLGQRKGIYLSGGPWFVSRKDPHANVVYVSRHYHDEERRRDSFICGGFNWIGAERPDAAWPLYCKVRHGPNMYRCTMEELPGGQAKVLLEGNDQGLAAGQFACFYQDGVCLGSAVILQGMS